MNQDPFRTPTDAEIASAESKLGIIFHDDYRLFLKSGSDVANAIFEPAVILPGSGHLDIFEIAETAWNVMGLPRDLFPFIEDNGDYFCIAKTGEVVYWSHNGSANERWQNFSAWHKQVCVDRQ
ncbi:SMI1/KNR4 family protein [Pseudomonas sediminis]|uniref:SMI1/KNR4 family protein n=1 Tax=Pseudomonas sediminis TaxID=1691904 RepID=A0ABX6SQ93_9PSED|nr:SMI1/KNR4 family protein [Pseudomonas sediminis]QNH01930.1 SMI1/KNR4 family protein [Pseudomonas sediminis]